MALTLQEAPQYPSLTPSHGPSVVSFAPQVSAVERSKQVLLVFGPPFARRRSFWQSAAIAFLQGIFLGGVGLGFFNGFEWLSDQWLTTESVRALSLSLFAW